MMLIQNLKSEHEPVNQANLRLIFQNLISAFSKHSKVLMEVIQ